MSPWNNFGQYNSEHAPPQQRSTHGTRLFLRQHVMRTEDDSFIENEVGQRVLFLDGKAYRLSDQLSLKDMQGSELATIPEQLALRDNGVIYYHGQIMARVRMIFLTREYAEFAVDVADGDFLEVGGNALTCDYVFLRGQMRVAEVSRHSCHGHDYYSIAILPDGDEVVILATMIVIDGMLDSYSYRQDGG